MLLAAGALLPEDGDGAAKRNRIPATARREIEAVELEIDRIESESLNKARSASVAFPKTLTHGYLPAKVAQ
jgi:hypothetical protein